jgi:cytochrome b pre-mRNA-processing protein 3
MLKWLFGKTTTDPSEALYAAIAKAARAETFYADWHVPDTMEGRFDMLVLHVYLVLDRLRDFGTEAEPLRQALTDRFFAAMDGTLREVGVGDLAVGKKVRKMAEAFFGRVSAYEAAMKQGEGAMAQALSRNVYAMPTSQYALQLAEWSLRARQHLNTSTLAELAVGKVSFQ